MSDICFLLLSWPQLINEMKCNEILFVCRQQDMFMAIATTFVAGLNFASLSIVLHISSSNYNWLIIGVLWLKHTTAKSQFVQFTIVELVWRKYFLLTLVFPLLTSTLGSTFSFSKCSCKFDSPSFFIIRGWEYVLDRAKKRILIKNNKYAWKDRYALSCV